MDTLEAAALGADVGCKLSDALRIRSEDRQLSIETRGTKRLVGAVEQRSCFFFGLDMRTDAQMTSVPVYDVDWWKRRL